MAKRIRSQATCLECHGQTENYLYVEDNTQLPDSKSFFGYFCSYACLETFKETN